MKRDEEQIQRIKEDANGSKEKLMDLVYKLRDAGGNREANSLESIISKLEAWQNK